MKLVNSILTPLMGLLTALLVVAGLSFGTLVVFDWSLIDEVFASGTVRDIVYLLVAIGALLHLDTVVDFLRGDKIK